MRNFSNSFFFWFDITETEVFNIIKSLDPNKTSGEDRTSVKTLKNLTILFAQY